MAASLLIILGEPHFDTQIRPILDRILEGLTAWDQNKATVDLNTELLNFINKNVPPEKAEGGTILRSEGKIYIEILVHPTVGLLTQCLQNFFYQTTPYKLIVHAGPAYQGTGSWILRDGTFSLHDFARFIHRNDIASVLREREGTTTTISCLNEGEWNENGFKLHDLSKRYSMHVQEKGTYNDLQCDNNVCSYFGRYLMYCELTELMPSSNIVGSVRFRRPTIYLFPAGQGDAAMFGVSGFTMLLDGGYQWKSCFWDFLRHVDRIDALLISRLNPNTINGARSFVKRLTLQPETHPKLGYAFMNAPSRQQAAALEATSKNPLLISIFDQTFDVLDALAHLSMDPHPLAFSVSASTKHVEPLMLYQKVGHGRLEMYVLNPAKDSKELNDFVTNWKRYAHAPQTPGQFSVKPGVASPYPVPMSAQTSVAALIVWHPANAQENIIRVLYPGSCPQDRIFQAMDKLKHLDFLKHSACTPASLEGGKGVKGTPARKPQDNMAKLLSPTPKPSKHDNTGPSNRISPAPGGHLGVVAHENAVPEPPKSPKVETSLQMNAPSAHAGAEHNVPGEVIEHHSLSASAVHARPHAAPMEPQNEIVTPPKSPNLVSFNDSSSPAAHIGEPASENLLDDFVGHEQHVTTTTTTTTTTRHEQRAFPDDSAPENLLGDFAAEEHREHVTTERKIVGDHEIVTERREVKHVEHHGGHADDLLGAMQDHEMSGFEPHHHHGAAHPGELIAGALTRTDDNTSDDATSPLSPPNSEESHAATKESPVDPVQHPLHELDTLDRHHGHQPPAHSPGGGDRKPRLNPDAPAFVPRHSFSSDDATAGDGDLFGGKSSVSPGALSPTDPVGVVNGGGGDVSLLPDVPVIREFPNAFNEHYTCGVMEVPKSVDEMMKDLQPLDDAAKADAQQHENQKKSVDDLMKDWGKPLGAPPPPNATAKQPAAAASKKPAPAAAASKAPEKPKPAAAAAAAPAKKPAPSPGTSTKSAANGGPAANGPATKKPAAATAAKPSAAPPKPSAPPKSNAPTTNKLNTSVISTKSTTTTTTVKTTTAAAPKPAASKPAPAASKSPAAAAAPSKPTPSAASASAKSTPSAASASSKPTASATPSKAQPASAKKPTPGGSGPPFYVDLAYIPHGGNPHFVNSDFFKNIRSKYYVLSALQAPKEVLESLLAGKKSWNLPEEEVTLIPTYDSDNLNYWMSLHRDDLTTESIEVAPSCARCSLNLEEHHGTVCAAYRLEL